MINKIVNANEIRRTLRNEIRKRIDSKINKLRDDLSYAKDWSNQERIAELSIEVSTLLGAKVLL